jgi:hypothetical protein
MQIVDIHHTLTVRTGLRGHRPYTCPAEGQPDCHNYHPDHTQPLGSLRFSITQIDCNHEPSLGDPQILPFTDKTLPTFHQRLYYYLTTQFLSWLRSQCLCQRFCSYETQTQTQPAVSTHQYQRVCYTQEAASVSICMAHQQIRAPHRPRLPC